MHSDTGVLSKFDWNLCFLGIPSLGLPSIDPVEVKEYHIEEASFAQHYFDSKLYGYAKAKISNSQ